MIDVSIFLAKVFGIYLMLISVAMFLKPQRFKDLATKMLNDEAVLSLAMIITLILGSLIIVSHNIWVMDWRVFITLLGWLILAKSAIILFSPKLMAKLVKIYEIKSAYLISGAISFLLGLLFICKGFFA